MKKVSYCFKFALSCAPLAVDAVHFLLVDKSCTESSVMSFFLKRYLSHRCKIQMLPCTSDSELLY